ncbi:MAG: response regulator [Candidatus Omnitrophota bacterium]
MAKKRILVVDDEIELVKAIRLRLEHAGYEVLLAYNGREGFEKAEKEKPNLILMDVLMPEMDGLQAVEKLKTNNQTEAIPVLMLTAKSQLTDVTKATNLGAEDYIVKPFDSKVLLEKVKKALRT